MGTDIHGVLQVKWGDRWEYRGDIEDDRNYLVFAILAGVRNGFGFAGCKTHSPIKPIDEPRGLPDDLGFKERSYAEFDDPSIDKPDSREIPFGDFDFGDHSQSWLTLREVLNWPHWKDGFTQHGILDREEYEAVIKEGRKPTSWCGGISGPGVIKTTCQEVLAATAPEGWTHVQYSWPDTIQDRCKTFCAWLRYMEMKWAWQMEKDPDNVRIVFGFDS